MTKAFAFLGLSITSLGFGLMLRLSYCAGRWGRLSFVGAESLGLLVMGAGMLALALCFGRNKILERLTGSRFNRFITMFGVVIVLLAVVRIVSFNLLLSVYASGFERTALEVAPIPKWRSLLPLGEAILSGKDTNRLETILPGFIGKVYANQSPYCGIGGDVGDLNVAVWWRQPTLVIGIVIGKHGGLDGELYRKRSADDVAVVIAR